MNCGELETVIPSCSEIVCRVCGVVTVKTRRLLFIYLFMKFVLGRKQETELTIGDRQRDTIECSSAFVMTTKEVGLKVQRL